MEHEIQEYKDSSSEHMKKKIMFLSIVSLITAAILEWLPVFSFFAPVPLFYLLFLQGKKYFLFSLLIVALLSFLNTTVVSLVSGVHIATNEVTFSFIMIVVSLLPLTFFTLPVRIKIRYRVFLASICSVIIWIVSNSVLHLDKKLEELFIQLLSSIGETPFVGSEYSVEYLSSLMITIVRYSLAPASLLMYALSWNMANSLAYKKTHGTIQKFNLLRFYNDQYMMFLLSVAMVAIIINYFLNNTILAIGAWNVLFVSLLWFSLQGLAICSFMMHRNTKHKKQQKIFLLIFSFILIVTNGWIIFLGMLMIVGIVEYFIPIRTRFKHIDSVDPTPGRDTDHKE